MEWLVTVAESTDPATVAAELAPLGGSLRADLPAVPQDDGTKILYAVGPAGLDAAAAAADLTHVVAVHPLSRQEPY